MTSLSVFTNNDSMATEYAVKEMNVPISPSGGTESKSVIYSTSGSLLGLDGSWNGNTNYWYLWDSTSYNFITIGVNKASKSSSLGTTISPITGFFLINAWAEITSGYISSISLKSGTHPIFLLSLSPNEVICATNITVYSTQIYCDITVSSLEKILTSSTQLSGQSISGSYPICIIPPNSNTTKVPNSPMNTISILGCQFIQISPQVPPELPPMVITGINNPTKISISLNLLYQENYDSYGNFMLRNGPFAFLPNAQTMNIVVGENQINNAFIGSTVPLPGYFIKNNYKSTPQKPMFYAIDNNSGDVNNQKIWLIYENGYIPITSTVAPTGDGEKDGYVLTENQSIIIIKDSNNQFNFSTVCSPDSSGYGWGYCNLSQNLDRLEINANLFGSWNALPSGTPPSAQMLGRFSGIGYDFINQQILCLDGSSTTRLYTYDPSSYKYVSPKLNITNPSSIGLSYIMAISATQIFALGGDKNAYMWNFINNGWQLIQSGVMSMSIDNSKGTMYLLMENNTLQSSPLPSSPQQGLTLSLINNIPLSFTFTDNITYKISYICAVPSDFNLANLLVNYPATFSANTTPLSWFLMSSSQSNYSYFSSSSSLGTVNKNSYLYEVGGVPYVASQSENTNMITISSLDIANSKLQPLYNISLAYQFTDGLSVFSSNNSPLKQAGIEINQIINEGTDNVIALVTNTNTNKQSCYQVSSSGTFVNNILPSTYVGQSVEQIINTVTVSKMTSSELNNMTILNNFISKNLSLTEKIRSDLESMNLTIGTFLSGDYVSS